MVYFVFFRVFLLIFNYCFIYLIKNITVIYSLSDTDMLGQLFIIKKIISDFFPSGGLYLVRRIRELQFSYRLPYRGYIKCHLVYVPICDFLSQILEKEYILHRIVFTLLSSVIMSVFILIIKKHSWFHISRSYVWFSFFFHGILNHFSVKSMKRVIAK